MKHIIIFLAVLAPFVPELGGQAAQARLGGIGTADRLLVPAFIALFVIARRLPRIPLERMFVPLIAFVAIALLSSISIPLRFETGDPRSSVVGVFRVAKFAGYTALAIASLRIFAAAAYRRTVILGWCAGTAMLSATLIRQALELDGGTKVLELSLGVHGNPSSVALACTTVSIFVALRSERLSRRDSRLLLGLAVVGMLGMLFSQGRGGWVSLILGTAFMIRRFRFRYLLGAVTLAAVVALAASNSVTVERNLSKLLVSEQGYSASGEDADTSMDDGGRIATWGHEAAKLTEHPVLGYGIFHRGGASALWTTGSHNFFLQMFLETGLLGGSAFLAFVWSLWRGTGSLSGPIRIGAQAVLITMVAGGVGGEYFYGDAPLYCLFISLWMLAIPEEMQLISRVPPKQGGQPPRSSIQPFRSRSENTARSGTFSAASASEPPSPRSTTQSAPIT